MLVKTGVDRLGRVVSRAAKPTSGVIVEGLGYTVHMSYRTRRLIANFLIAVLLVNLLGLSTSAVADRVNHHAATSAATSAPDGGASDQDDWRCGCSHACHAAQHLMGATGELRTYSLLSVGKQTERGDSVFLPSLRSAPLLRPPRALA